MVHGMDIDMCSRLVTVNTFTPSKLDLIHIENSFVSATTFSTKGNDGCYKSTTIKDSSIGYLVHVTPGVNELNITNTIVPPMTHVTESIKQEKLDTRCINLSVWGIMKQETLMSIGYVISFGLLFCTLIPSYELWMQVFGNPQSIFMAVPALATSIALQKLSWAVLFAGFQYITLLGSYSTHRPYSNTMYSVYQTSNFVYHKYSFINTLLGSPPYTFIMRFLGVKNEGRALLYPFRFDEYPYISITNKTVVDGAYIGGHYVVYSEIILGPCKASGVMHEMYFAANALVVAKESEPWRANMGSYRDYVELETMDYVEPTNGDICTEHMT